MTAIQIIERGYTKSELQWELARKRKGRVPRRTLDFWIQELKMYPDPELGLFVESDLEILKGLISWLKSGRTIAQYKIQLMRTQSNAS